jgi:hypothetical protein
MDKVQNCDSYMYRLDLASPVKRLIEVVCQYGTDFKIALSKKFYDQLSRTKFHINVIQANHADLILLWDMWTRSLDTAVELKVVSPVGQNVMNGLTKGRQGGTCRDESTTQFWLRHFRDVHYGWTRAQSCWETDIIV